jgi:hypothetical protein
MAEQSPAKMHPDERFTSQVHTAALPDVATQPHPTADALPPNPEGSAKDTHNRLKDVLPAIAEVAQKVGGYRKLSEIAAELDRMEK